MTDISRRDFTRTTIGGPVAAWAAWAMLPDGVRAETTDQLGQLRLATFRFDVTPPVGHALCGGWIQSVVAVDDPLEAIGVVLLGAGAPIVLCAVDWTGILNSAHLRWRQALADAAGTTADRVALHSVHQHNAPFACLDTQRIVSAQPGLPSVIDPGFFEQCLTRATQAVTAALPGAGGHARRGHTDARRQGRVEPPHLAQRGEPGRGDARQRARATKRCGPCPRG